MVRLLQCVAWRQADFACGPQSLHGHADYLAFGTKNRLILSHKNSAFSALFPTLYAAQEQAFATTYK